MLYYDCHVHLQINTKRTGHDIVMFEGIHKLDIINMNVL